MSEVFVADEVIEEFSIRQSEDDGRECAIEQSILAMRNDRDMYSLTVEQIAVVREEAVVRLCVCKEFDDDEHAEELRAVRRTLAPIRRANR